MNATDLMLGDWVLTLDSTHKEKVFAQVDAIEEGKHSILVTRECSNWFVDIDWIEPIPLTKEIIEKNFTLNEKYQEQFGDNHHFYYNIVPKYSSSIWNLVWIEGSNENCLLIEDDPLIHMKYVHELQHALKLCGISKEIIL